MKTSMTPLESYPIDHIGIAVTNLDGALQMYQSAFGMQVDLRETIASQGVEVAFLKAPNTLLELLTPTSPTSTLTKFLATKGQGLHHICFRVPDIRKSLQELKTQGFRLIDESPRPGAHKSEIAFIHPKSTAGVLIELCQHTTNEDHSA
jgi:methylmalonyl-CoA/ethylmalonyl-CoA epimerase